MSHYKTFGQTAGIRTFTPRHETIPMVLTQQPQQQSYPSQHTMIEDIGGGFEVPQYNNPQQMYVAQSMPSSNMLPPNMPPVASQQQYSPEQLQYQQQSSECALVAQHIEMCKLCARLYKKDKHKYLTTIIGLCLIILFLIIKLAER